MTDKCWCGKGLVLITQPGEQRELGEGRLICPTHGENCLTTTDDVRDGTTNGNEDPAKCHICGEYAPNRCKRCARRVCWKCEEGAGMCLACAFGEPVCGSS